MKSNYLFYFVIDSLLLYLIASESYPIYDKFYIQDPCEVRTITPGQNGWRRYGFIQDSISGCMYENQDCRIYLNVTSGYHITMRFQYISYDCDYGKLEVLEGSGDPLKFCGYGTPIISIYSASNWLRYRFVTASYPVCQTGFSLYYTTYHTGECSENEFECSIDDRCIPEELKCDGFDNCGDWSDEMAGTCGLTTGAIVAISVTCALVGLSCLAFLVYCLYDRAHRRNHSSTARRGSSNRCSPETATTVPIAPPSYAESPPDYTYVNTVYSGIYEDVDQSKAPPTYQSISNNNGFPN